ncbi:MAG: S1 family peptidase [Akkermansiaceae bacterium]|nr:S1 family peptidase [Akkermansiaceae bacterium]
MNLIHSIVLLGLISLIPCASGITWRSQYYSQSQAQAFGRDHVSFHGVGIGFGCTGTLFHSNRHVITAAHCTSASSWKIRSHAHVATSSHYTVPNYDVRVCKLAANSGGTTYGLNGVMANEVGRDFHKNGTGAYGDIGSVNFGGWWQHGYPLAGRNTYTTVTGGTLRYVLKTNAASVGTAPGDSGSSGLMKHTDGKWYITSTTNGPGSGFYVDTQSRAVRSYIYQRL